MVASWAPSFAIGFGERVSMYTATLISEIDFEAARARSMASSTARSIQYVWSTSRATQLLTTRTTYTVTPLMFVSALLQYNSSNDSLGANLRLRWEYQPGSELFVVYNEQRDTRISGYPALENRAFIIKINRLFRF